MARSQILSFASPQHRRQLLILVALYFVSSIFSSFPLTAYGYWLIVDLKIEPGLLSTYFAVTFIPYCFKPVYAACVAVLPSLRGRKRGIVISFSFIGCAISYACMARFVHTTSQAFGVGFINSCFTACAEFVMDTIIVDLAHSNQLVPLPFAAASLQTVIMAVRMAIGPLVALVLGFPLYPCDHPNQQELAPRKVMLVSICLPLLAALISPLLVEPSTGSLVAPAVSVDSAAEPTKRTSPLITILKHWRISLAFVWVQLLAVWGGIKDLMGYHAWMACLYALIGSFACIIASFASEYHAEDKRRELMLNLRQLKSHWRLVAPGIALFLYNAAPSSFVQWYTYEYVLFGYFPCKLQWINFCAGVSRIVACAVFYGFLRHRSVLKVITVAGVFCALTALTWIALLHPRFVNDSLNMSLFTYTMLITALDTFASQLSFMPLVILATMSCPPKNSGAAYSMYISLMNVGDNASMWMTGPIVTRLGITYSDWSGMEKLTVICSSCEVAMAIFVPIVVWLAWGGQEPKHNADDALGGVNKPATTNNNSNNINTNAEPATAVL